MTSMAGPVLAAGTVPAADLAPGYPFRGLGLAARVVPFAAIAMIAELSLALPPGPGSAWAAAVSAVLLAVVAAGFLLPWTRLPGWTAVLPPLAYTGSVLALILGAGATSGVGIVILIPLVWTALFQRLWQSACVVAAIVVTEVVISVVPVAVPEAVIARRVILWTALGVVVSVATHGLRDRLRQSLLETAEVEGRLREITLLEDRDRIAAGLQDKVIQRVFAAGLTLQGAAAMVTQPEAQRRIASVADDLDQVIRAVRDSVFGLEKRLKGRGIREQILGLCNRLDETPAVGFAGPVDGALHPETGAGLVQVLSEALPVIAGSTRVSRVDVIADQSEYVVTIEGAPSGRKPEATAAPHSFDGLRDSATAAGLSLQIQPMSAGMRFTWQVPLGAHP